MEAFFLFLVKSSICLALFYLFYKWLLSRETFFRFNRWVLLSGITVCILLPFVSLPVAKETILQKPFIELESRILNDNALNDNSQAIIIEWTEVMDVQTEEKKVNHAVEEKNGSISPLLIIASAYGIGFCINLILLLLSAFKMFRLLSKGEKRPQEKYTLVLIREKTIPFSFGRFIALSQTDYLHNSAEIICHEKIHVRKKHSLDMIFIELLILLFWFNPVIRLLKRELRDIHEYEADNGVIQSGIDATKYQLLLIKKAAGTRSYAIANSFNHSKIKNRITMMLKKKSTQTARLKTMLFVPLAAAGLLAFAQPKMVQMEEWLEQDESTSIFQETQQATNDSFVEDIKATAKESDTDKIKKQEEIISLPVISENDSLIEKYQIKMAIMEGDSLLSPYIRRYNSTLAEKERLLPYAGEDSPIRKRLNENLDLLKEDIRKRIALRATFIPNGPTDEEIMSAEIIGNDTITEMNYLHHQLVLDTGTETIIVITIPQMDENGYYITKIPPTETQKIDEDLPASLQIFYRKK
jgi:hypothetical protein